MTEKLTKSSLLKIYNNVLQRITHQLLFQYNIILVKEKENKFLVNSLLFLQAVNE